MSTYEKIYERVNWENDPSTATPINEDNLNNMDSAIDILDDRVVELSQYTPSIQEVEELPEQGVEGIFYEVNGSFYVWNDASSSYTQLANQSAITDMQYLVFIDGINNTINKTFANIANKIQTPTGNLILAKLWYQDSNNVARYVWGSLSSSNLYSSNNYIKFLFNISEGDRNIIKEYSLNVNNELSVTTYSQVNQAKLTAGANITIDDTDPSNPVISSTGGGGGGSYVGGKGISISGNTINADANVYSVKYTTQYDLDSASQGSITITPSSDATFSNIYAKCFSENSNMQFRPTICFSYNNTQKQYGTLVQSVTLATQNNQRLIFFVISITGSGDKTLSVIHYEDNTIVATVNLNPYYIAGDGISITNRVISVNYPNGDLEEY